MNLPRIAGLGWLVLSASIPAVACKCELQLNVCAETAYSSLVFVGTVESVVPPFLTQWKPAPQQDIDRINRLNDQYLANPSAASLAELKNAMRSTFPGLPDADRKRLEGASSGGALSKLLASVLDGVRTVHFRVRTILRKDDDEDKKDDDDANDEEPKQLDVVTPFGDCGLDFQVGETYVVYATSDEETNILETNACTRTRRLSDAGSDLAYLYFYKDRKQPAGRLQGFTTSDRMYQMQVRDPDHIPSPVAGVTIELKAHDWTRYTTANPQGQFLFDGLEAGDYELTPYPPQFPESRTPLSAPRKFHMDERGCVTQILIIPRPAP